MIYETFASSYECNQALREINSIRQVLPRGAWIDTPVPFDHSAPPQSTPNRCPAALVLNPIVGSGRHQKTVMDGDSSLNLIHENTLDKMLIDKFCIEQSCATFKGIVPRREARCSGKMTMVVVIGTPRNYRSEAITFISLLSRADTMPSSDGAPSLNSKKYRIMAT